MATNLNTKQNRYDTEYTQRADFRERFELCNNEKAWQTAFERTNGQLDSLKPLFIAIANVLKKKQLLLSCDELTEVEIRKKINEDAKTLQLLKNLRNVNVCKDIARFNAMTFYEFAYNVIKTYHEPRLHLSLKNNKVCVCIGFKDKNIKLSWVLLQDMLLYYRIQISGKYIDLHTVTGMLQDNMNGLKPLYSDLKVSVMQLYLEPNSNPMILKSYLKTTTVRERTEKKDKIITTQKIPTSSGIVRCYKAAGQVAGDDPDYVKNHGAYYDDPQYYAFIISAHGVFYGLFPYEWYRSELDQEVINVTGDDYARIIFIN
jgi:hypothetical protein